MHQLWQIYALVFKRPCVWTCQHRVHGASQLCDDNRIRLGILGAEPESTSSDEVTWAKIKKDFSACPAAMRLIGREENGVSAPSGIGGSCGSPNGKSGHLLIPVNSDYQRTGDQSP
jgi:hypothetical protein